MRSKERAIKGPGLKLDLDVRRCWECPACGRRIKRQGEVVSYQCHCQEPPVWMHLMEPARAAREYQPYIVPEIQADDLMDQETPPAAEEVLPEETEILMEVALTQELLEIPVEDVPVEDVSVEDVPAEEEFYSPEEEIQAIPQSFEMEIPKLPEPAPAEPTPSAGEPSSQQPERSTEPNPKPGKSKRRRSGRKRHRRGKPG